MLYDVYRGLVVQRSHYTHIVTIHHPHTITIITEQEMQSQPQPPHRKADTEKITLLTPQHTLNIAMMLHDAYIGNVACL